MTAKHTVPHNGPNVTSDSDSEVTHVGTAHEASERVKSRRKSTASASTLLSPDIFSDTESSFQYTASDAGAFSEDINKSDPRYLYYRVYTEDGAIPSNAPLDAGDPYLARILAKSVAPPHTVSSLKRCLSKVESIVNHRKTSLFLSTSSQTPMDDGHRLSLLNGSGPGSTPQEPMALVVKSSESERNTLAGARTSPDISASSRKVRYLYYRIYTADGAIISKNKVAESNDVSLGCVNTVLFAPPHTVDPSNVACATLKISATTRIPACSLLLHAGLPCMTQTRYRSLAIVDRVLYLKSPWLLS